MENLVLFLIYAMGESKQNAWNRDFDRRAAIAAAVDTASEQPTH